MNKVLFDDLGRLRSGWRFAVFFAAFTVCTVFLVSAAQGLFLATGYDPKKNVLLLTVISTGTSLFVALLIGWLAGLVLEGLPFKALGASFTKGWLRDLIAGVALGALAVVAAVAFGSLVGGLGFEFNAAAGWSAIARSLGLSLLIFTVGAAFEEALVRGYMLQTFVRSKLAWLAILLTSFIFASGHIGNPSAGTFSFINTFLAGIWLGLAYLKTRTLWLPFGLHLAWNLVLGSVFGIEVSGLTELTAAPLLKEIDAGPEWITGGTYGLEGGFACTFALIASTAAMWFAPFLRSDEEMAKLTSPPESGESTAESAEGLESLDVKETSSET